MIHSIAITAFIIMVVATILGRLMFGDLKPWESIPVWFSNIYGLGVVTTLALISASMVTLAWS